MNIQAWLQLLAEQIKETNWLQWLALILGVAEVLLARANKISLYPTGIAASAISVYLLWQVGLYGECLLSCYYIVMSIYGWWYWLKKKDVPPVEISYSGRKDWITITGIVVIGYVLLYVVLKNFTPSTVPHWDAFITSTAWAGMWLLAKRKIENWVLLNISNAFAIPILFHKGLPLYALLTLVLFIVAVQGFFSWRKKIKTQFHVPNPRLVS
ncbi:nicotinamide riboside transporter PnuC [Segetibacter sp. 3557_3]|uniref:nicotinamide riboside transporter PnuC n=1 Tax=Segetibacter sp. 3557_3 TaxID=2547429 RepID=UPI001058A7B7|nr:nicotinamide riboside transporter PnuC [Segetibacter sp. 3557_3]TDH26624.1 nicotinamide riboside transporter PnuC [Segetibacter sp. 3557_3]